MNHPVWLIPSRSSGRPLVGAPGAPATAVAASASALDDAQLAVSSATPGWYRSVHRAPWVVYLVWAAVVFVVVLAAGRTAVVNALITAVIGGLVLGVVTLPVCTRLARRSRAVRGAHGRLLEAAVTHHDRARLTPDETAAWARGIVEHDLAREDEAHSLLWEASATTTTEPTRESRAAAARLFTLWSATPEGQRKA